ncbi:transmembrane protein, putative [Medicago truncatula]|uniref:Transmembrane protein, putative n=1 Tax=Medicago truncatula TaxID=3880 RepID=A0A072TEA0_MEDTR|nr:transmembrane protein, putative [Medicago truncatula]
MESSGIHEYTVRLVVVVFAMPQSGTGVSVGFKLQVGWNYNKMNKKALTSKNWQKGSKLQRG